MIQTLTDRCEFVPKPLGYFINQFVLSKMDHQAGSEDKVTVRFATESLDHSSHSPSPNNDFRKATVTVIKDAAVQPTESLRYRCRRNRPSYKYRDGDDDPTKHFASACSVTSTKSLPDFPPGDDFLLPNVGELRWSSSEVLTSSSIERPYLTKRSLSVDSPTSLSSSLCPKDTSPNRSNNDTNYMTSKIDQSLSLPVKPVRRASGDEPLLPLRSSRCLEYEDPGKCADASGSDCEKCSPHATSSSSSSSSSPSSSTTTSNRRRMLMMNNMMMMPPIKPIRRSSSGSDKVGQVAVGMMEELTLIGALDSEETIKISNLPSRLL